MVLNNVTKPNKILIKTIRLSEWSSFITVNFHKQRTITAESMVRNGHYQLEEDTMVLNSVTKFHKMLIKSIQLREPTSFKTIFFINKGPLLLKAWCDMDHYQT